MPPFAITQFDEEIYLWECAVAKAVADCPFLACDAVNEHWITVKGGGHIKVTDSPITGAHVSQAIKDFGLHKKAATVLSKAHKSGLIKTDKHLYHTIALAHSMQAVKQSSAAGIGNTLIEKALQHGPDVETFGKNAKGNANLEAVHKHAEGKIAASDPGAGQASSAGSQNASGGNSAASAAASQPASQSQQSAPGEKWVMINGKPVLIDEATGKPIHEVNQTGWKQKLLSKGTVFSKRLADGSSLKVYQVGGGNYKITLEIPPADPSESATHEMKGTFADAEDAFNEAEKIHNEVHAQHATSQTPAAGQSAKLPEDSDLWTSGKNSYGETFSVDTDTHQGDVYKDNKGNWLANLDDKDTLNNVLHQKFGTPEEAKAAIEAELDKIEKANNPPAPEPAKEQHVTIGSEKLTHEGKALTQSDIDAIKGTNKADLLLSSNGQSALQKAFDDGDIKTDADLHNVLAVAKASTQANTSYAKITGVGIAEGLKYGTVQAVKEKAEAGDAEAAKIAAKLGDTSYKTATEQKAEQMQNLTADYVLGKKLAGPGGGNAGGVYEAKDGTQFYVKFYSDSQQAHGEHLANAIYKGLGLAAPESGTFAHNGKTAYASQMLDKESDLGKKGLTKATAQEVLKGFAADVLLGNWDAYGASGDNMAIGKDGKTLIRMDNGGSLFHRALGDKKHADDLDNIHEWANFSKAGMQYSQIFKKAGVKSAEEITGIEGQIKAIESLRDSHGGWDKFVAKSAPQMSPSDQKAFAALLEKRTDLLAQKRTELLQAKMGKWEAIVHQYSNGQHAQTTGGGSHWPVSHTSDQAGSKWADQVFAEQMAKTTPEQKQGIHYWKGSGYQGISKALFKGNLSKASAQVKQAVKQLDDFFASPHAKAPEAFIVQRRFHIDAGPENTAYKNFQPGDEFTVKGFQATSVGVSPGYGHGEFMAHILCPKGTPACWVEGTLYGAGNVGEHEVLLDRNLKFRVVKNEHVNGTWHQTWEAIL